MSVIQSILDRIDEWVDNEAKTFFIMEPDGYPCFLQFAKLGENFLLDIPASNFFEPDMEEKLYFLCQNRFRKTISQEKDETRLLSYQIRFSSVEINKMCYVAKEVFETVLCVDEDCTIHISMR